MKLVIYTLLVAGSLQGAATVTSVVSAASFRSNEVGLGGYVSIFGTGLSEGTAVAPVPYPLKLGATEVYVCNGPAPIILGAPQPVCVQVPVQFASPSQVNVILVGLTLTSDQYRYMVVRVNGVADTSGGFSFLLKPRAGSIFPAGRDCPIDSVPATGGGPRWSGVGQNCGIFPSEPVPPTPAPLILPTRANRAVITDLNGNLVWSGNPAKIGGFYTIWLTGMGTVRPADLGISYLFSAVPVYGYKPTIASVNVTYLGSVPQFPGLYQMNFQIPQSVASEPVGYGMWPCGNYSWEVKVSVGFDDFDFPLVIRNGDVPCKI